MPRVDIEDLENLDSADKLAETFCHRLNYEYVGMPISPRRWKEKVVESIANNDIELLAKHMDFHIIRCRLAELRLGVERRIITQLLREHPYLLVIFSDRDFRNWHFVNIKYDDQSKNRRLFRRITIGPDELVHTASQRINMLEVVDERMSPLELQIRHDEAFDVEKVTKEFYISILRSFMKLVGGEVVIGSHRESYLGFLRLPQTIDHNKKQEFATRLIGRIIFCWFLRKKKSLQGRSLIPREILSEESLERYSGYYHTILEPLFFQQLNTPTSERKEQYRNSDIPFLNGGLFQPHRDDFYEPNELGLSKHMNALSIPDKWFKELFGVLERYNFTIDESTPLDVTLSIDPEILGRIFENLLAEINPETGESARKSTGSYYTPRAIVEYMVTESVRHYLLDKSNIGLEKLSCLLSYDDEIPVFTEQEKSSVTDALDRLKVIDSACGSGAFPMGILQKVVLILQKVDPDCKRWLNNQLSRIPDAYLRKQVEDRLSAENLDYIRKLGVVQNTIYGVDVQPMAIEIAKLRFFLSLIVDRDIDDTKENRGVEPLPNLEFKFVPANTLLGVPRMRKQFSFGESDKDIVRLRHLRNEYFMSFGDEKREVEKEFKRVQERMFGQVSEWYARDGQSLALSTWNPFSADEPARFFDPGWMFGVSDGFDIAIANPPYIGEKGHKEVFRALRNDDWGRKYYQAKMDILYFFFHKALDLVRDKGIISFITTNYYVTATGARRLREDFRNRSTILHLINLNELRIFQAAPGQHNMITIVAKRRDENALARSCVTRRTGIATQQILERIVNGIDKETRYYRIAQRHLYEGQECYIRLTGAIEKSDDSMQRILGKLSCGAVLLGTICNINSGADITISRITNKHIEKFRGDFGPNQGVFVLSDQEVKELALSNDEQEIVKDFIKNSNVNKFFVTLSNQNLIYLRWEDDIECYPNIKRHLSRFREILEDQANRYEENYPWFALHRPRDQGIFKSAEKIVVPYRSRTNVFGYSTIPLYSSRDVFFITKRSAGFDLKYILSLLNSRIYYFWFYFKGKRKGEILELYQRPLSEVPIRQISSLEQQPFIQLVDRILSMYSQYGYPLPSQADEEVTQLERQIDHRVHELYGLTEEEIALVEGSM